MLFAGTGAYAGGLWEGSLIGMEAKREAETGSRNGREETTGELKLR